MKQAEAVDVKRLRLKEGYSPHKCGPRSLVLKQGQELVRQAKAFFVAEFVPLPRHSELRQGAEAASGRAGAPTYAPLEVENYAGQEWWSARLPRVARS
jgi:hypothetical protein